MAKRNRPVGNNNSGNLVALKAERANYTNLTAEIAAAKSELAVITADIARVRSMFKTA